MTKSELIDQLAEIQRHLAHLDVELGVKSILEQMSGEETRKRARQSHCPESTFLISNRVKHYASASITRRVNEGSC
jgi:hypothetical protein